MESTPSSKEIEQPSPPSSSLPSSPLPQENPDVPQIEIIEDEDEVEVVDRSESDKDWDIVDPVGANSGRIWGMVLSLFQHVPGGSGRNADDAEGEEVKGSSPNLSPGSLDSAAQKLLSAKQVIDMYGQVTESSGLSSSIVSLMGRALHAHVGGDGGPLIPVVKAAVGGGGEAYDNIVDHSASQQHQLGSEHDLLQGEAWRSSASVVPIGDAASAQADGINMGNAPANLGADAFVIDPSSGEDDRQQEQQQPQPVARLVGPVHYRYMIDHGSALSGAEGAENLDIAIQAVDRKVYEGDANLPVTGFCVRPHPLGSPASGSAKSFDPSNTFDLGGYVETLYGLSVGDVVEVCQGGNDSCESGKVLRDSAENGNGGRIVIGIDSNKGQETEIAIDMSSHGRRALDQGVFVYPRGGIRRRTESGLFTRQRALDDSSSPLITGTDALPETAFMRLALACAPTLLDHVRYSRKQGRGMVLTNLRQAADIARMPLEPNVESPPSSVTLEGLREMIRNDVDAYTAETLAQRRKRDAQKKGILERDRDTTGQTLSLPEWDEHAYGVPPLVSAANVIGRAEAVSVALHASPDKGHLAFLKSIAGPVFDETLERARRARSTTTGKLPTSPSSSSSSKRRMRGGANSSDQKHCVIDREPVPLSHAILRPAETRVLDDKRAAEFEASNLVAFLFSEIDIGGDVGSLPVVEQVMMLFGRDGDVCRRRLRSERKLALENERKVVLEGIPDVETLQENRARLLQGIEQARHRAASMRRRGGPPPSMWPQFIVPQPSVDVQSGFAREDAARALNDVLLRDFIELPFYRPELGALKISKEQEIRQRLAGKNLDNDGSDSNNDPTGPEVLASEIGRFYDQKRRSGDRWEPVALPAMMAHMLQALIDAPDSSSVVVRAGKNSEDALKDAKTARNRAADAKKRMAATLFACKKEVGALPGDAPPPPRINPTRTHMATVAVKRMTAIVDLQHPPSGARESIRQSFSTLSERKGELIEKHPDAARDFAAFRKNLETRIQFHAWARHHRQVLPACAAVLVEALDLPFGNDPGGAEVKRSLREAVDEAGRAMAALDRDERSVNASKSGIESAQKDLVQDERLAPGLASLRGLIGSGEDHDGSASGRRRRGDDSKGTTGSADSHTWYGFRPDHAQAQTASTSTVGLVDSVINDERRLKVSSYDRRPAKINACCVTPLTEDYNHVRFYRARVETALAELHRSGKAGSNTNRNVKGATGVNRIAWLESVLTPDYGWPVGESGDRPAKLVDGSGIDIEERKRLALEKQLSPVDLIRFRLDYAGRNNGSGPASNDATSSSNSPRPAVQVADVSSARVTDSDEKTGQKEAVVPSVAGALFKFGQISSSRSADEDAAWKKASDLLRSVDFKKIAGISRTGGVGANAAVVESSNINSDDRRLVQNRNRNQNESREQKRGESLLDDTAIAAIDPVVKRSVETWIDSVRPVGKYKGYADVPVDSKRKAGKRKRSTEGTKEDIHVSKEREEGDVIDRSWERVLDVSNKTSLADNLTTKHVLLAFIRSTLRPSLSCIAKSENIRTDAHRHRFCESGAGGALARLSVDLKKRMGDVGSFRSGAERALDGYTKGVARLEAEMEAAAPRSASVEYVINAVLAHAIVATLAEVADSSKKGRESDLEAASRLIRSMCEGLQERYEFAIKDQAQLRVQVQEQIERENREMQAIRQQIPEEQRQYLRELAKFKRIDRKDLEYFVQKGIRPEAAAEAEGVDYLVTTPPGVDDINKVREEDEVVGPDGMVEITKDMFGENRYSDLREPDYQVHQEQRYDGLAAGDEVDGGFDDDVDYEAEGGIDDGEGGDYE